MKVHSFLMLFFSLLSIQLSSQPVKVKVKVCPHVLRQKIVSVGGNYCQANYTPNAWDLVGEATLRAFRPSHVRLALPLQFRGLGYDEYKGEKINEQPAVITLFETMRRMKNEFGVSNFTISVWRVADELVENPERDNKRRIKPEKYVEVVDMIVAFLLKAKITYGVEADFFSFNESDGGYMTIFSPQETIQFIKIASERFSQVGLKTKFLWGDTAQTKGTVEFATMIAADSTIWKELGPLCFHSWWSEKVADSEFERIAGLGKAWGKEVWCNELGFDAMAWRVKGMNETWDYALRFAIITHRMLKHAEVAVSQYWTWQNNYSIMSADTMTKYPSYYVTLHHTRYLNRGTQIVNADSSDPDILSIAAIGADGQKIVQLINRKNVAVEVEVAGFEGNSAQQVITTEGMLWEEQTVKVRKSKGQVRLLLKPQSVNTLVISS